MPPGRSSQWTYWTRSRTSPVWYSEETLGGGMPGKEALGCSAQIPFPSNLADVERKFVVLDCGDDACKYSTQSTEVLGSTQAGIQIMTRSGTECTRAVTVAVTRQDSGQRMTRAKFKFCGPRFGPQIFNFARVILCPDVCSPCASRCL